MEPGTAILIASAINAAAKAGGDAISNSKAKKSANMRAKETKRETHAGMYNEALNRSAELEQQRLAGKRKLGKRRASSMQETADLVRGAFNI